MEESGMMGTLVGWAVERLVITAVLEAPKLTGSG